MSQSEVSAGETTFWRQLFQQTPHGTIPFDVPAVLPRSYGVTTTGAGGNLVFTPGIRDPFSPFDPVSIQIQETRRWDFEASIDSELQNLIDTQLTTLGLDLGDDDRYGIYAMTEGAGYLGRNDFVGTFTLGLSIFCFIPFVPPNLKNAAETVFIADRRADLFRGAARDPTVRVEVAARVNRPAFATVRRDLSRTGTTGLRVFDLFRFV